jgi:enoyl-CoA hydratase/carnithine racemase
MMEKGLRPIVAAIHGACVGGGMELASTCHIRVADETAFFAFPEGARGIFVGGGGSVRAPKLIGTHRMLDMMLTGRVYKAAEAVPVGFAQYLGSVSPSTWYLRGRRWPRRWNWRNALPPMPR